MLVSIVDNNINIASASPHVLRRIRTSHITNELVGQNLDDVFTEFYRLKSILNAEEQHTKNYIIIRLVTVIEQFFRKIVENSIEAKQFDSELNITIWISELDEMCGKKSKTISLGQSIQSGGVIEDVMRCCQISKHIIAKSKMNDVKNLFRLRNNIVHTVTVSSVNVKTNYEVVDNLIKTVVGQISYKKEDFYIAQGRAHYNLKEYEEAISEYDAALEIKPDSIIAYTLKARAFFKLAKYDEIVRCLDKIIEIEPDNITSHTIRTRMLKILKNQKK